jgi:hypothetical protein
MAEKCRLLDQDLGLWRPGHQSLPSLCPDWLARICKFLEPLVEAVPLARPVGRGQATIWAERMDVTRITQ